ncbi:MAG: AI-2E family transporter [Saprospiraceae bacterium]
MSNQDQEYVQPISFSRVGAFVGLVALSLFGAIWAKPILVPIVFAILFSLMLRPLCNFLGRWIQPEWLAITITFLIAALPIAAAILLFTFQTISVVEDLPTITEEFQESINRIANVITDEFPIDIEISGTEWVQEQFGDALDEPFVYIRGLVAGGAGLIASLLLIFLYTFMLLLYRQPIYHFVLGQFGIPNRRRMELVMADTQRMSYTYLKGLGLVMIILGFLNSAGLTLIGIEYAFFWGFFAAFLAIIPYVGTFLGGLMPFLYALSTTDTTWQPVAVVALFTVVQAIEGNIITPKVVGSSIQVNPLAAILALFIGGFIWGVEGLILALPVTAMLRIVLVHSGRFRPFGLLLSDELQDRESEFLTLLDKPRYRIINLFRNIPSQVVEMKDPTGDSDETNVDAS